MYAFGMVMRGSSRVMNVVCDEKKALKLVEEVGDKNWDDEYAKDNMDWAYKTIHEVKGQSCKRHRIFESMSKVVEKSLYLGCT